jgi:ankyrin repeat protein
MVRRTLDELPEDLPETYDRIIRNIDRSRAGTVAREVLRWMVHSQRQLTTSELLEVTGFLVQERPRFDREEALGDLDDILRICSSLVSVTMSEDGTSSQPDDRSERYAAFAPKYVRLAHASVREYLLSDKPYLAHYSLHDRESHDILASCCLVYLLRFEADEWTADDWESVFPLARYAAEFWTKHARISGGWSQHSRDLSMELLTRRKPAFRAWSYLGCKNHTADLPLLAASREGLTYAVRIILQKDNTNIDAWLDAWLDGWLLESRNALSEASAEGHEEIVEMLLHQGANVNTPSKWQGADALGIACGKSHDGIAIRLLNKGADPYAEHGYAGTALAIACRQGRDNLVERMLATDVPMDSHRKVGKALVFACANGHDRIARMLTHSNAFAGVLWEDVDCALASAIKYKHYKVIDTLFGVGDMHWRPDAALHAACRQGDEKLVRRLLNKADSADVASLELNKGLCIAFAGGHEGTVEVLLARGASGGNDALRAACAEGDERIYEILRLKKYIAGSDALDPAACAEGQGRVMRILLARGAKAYRSAFPRALQYACCGGYSDTVKALLKHDCGLAFLGEAGGESLQMACAGGHQSIVEMLLANGVSADYTGGTHGNTLTIACEIGDDKIVKMLLDRGANASGAFFPSGALFPQTRRYATPLQTACEGGHTTITRMLLEKGANVNDYGGYYGMPLHAACVRGHESIVDMLLTHGAEVNALGAYGWDEDCYCGVHSLTIACERGHKAIVRMLLARGADVNNHKVKPGRWFGPPTEWLPDRNALVAACDRGHEGIVRKILLKTAKADDEEGCNGSALLAACIGGYEEIVEMLLDKDAKVAIHDAYNDAIQTASDAGFEGIVEMLLDRAAGCRITTASRANAMPTEQVVLAKRRRLHQGSLPSAAQP